MIERAIALLLLNALWEPLAVAACAFVVLRIARNVNAATRCAVLTTAIVAALVLPIVTTGSVFRGEPAARLSEPVQHASSPVVHRHAALVTHSTQRASIETYAPAPEKPIAQRAVLWVPRIAVLALVAFWAAIALALLVRLLVSLAHLARLRRDALPISPELRTKLQRWNEKATGIEVRLCLSDETVVPIAVGLFDCMVLIPRRLLEELEPADLDRIVLHEIAHLRRRDGVVYALQQIACALYFFSPGIMWLGKTLDIEREVACDDWVIERASDAAPYANCLVRLAEGVPWPHKALAAPGAFVTRRSMSIRIERILQRARDARLKAAPAPVLAAVLAACIVAALGLTFAPSLAYPIAQVKPFVHVRPVVHVRPLVHVRPVVHVMPVVHVKPVVHVRPVVHAVPTVHVAPLVRVAPTGKPWVEVAANTKPTAKPDDDYISQMRALFGTSLSVDDLVGLKSLNVTPDYVRQLRANGFEGTVRQALAGRSVGLTPEKIAQFRSQFGSISFDDLIALASLRVDTNYRSELQAAGLSELTPRRLIELKALNISPEYVKEANGFGFGRLSADQLEELKSMHIDSAFLQRVREHGFNNLTLDQVIQLRATGVIK